MEIVVLRTFRGHGIAQRLAPWQPAGMDDAWNLKRFVTAQAPVRDEVENELAAGAKYSHWMWFVFPQLRDLGQSDRAVFYGLSGLDEASAYAAHPDLGPWLIRCVGLVARHAPPAEAILGQIDAMKFRSCLTLFSHVPDADPAFAAALARFYPGPDPETLRLLRGE